MNERNAVTPAGLLIREPRESEFPACRILLPEACAQPAGRLFRLVFESTGSSIVAALSYFEDSRGITGVRLHVVKKRRRSGIGSGVIQHLLDEAQRQAKQRVLVDADLKNEPDAEAFLTKRGFRLIGRLTSVHGPIVGRGAKRDEFQARLRGAAELPASSRMTSLADAPVDQIAQLYADHIANTPMMPGMERTLRADQYPESVVVMIGEKVIGFILARAETECVRVPALAVLPEYRGKGLAIRMIAAMEDKLGENIKRGEFEFTDSAIFTAKIAAAFGHEVARIGARFERSI